MKIARKITKTLTWIAGLVLVLAIAGVDSNSDTPMIIAVMCMAWLVMILIINYRELVQKYGG